MAEPTWSPKSNYPQSPIVSFGRAVAIGIGAGFVGAAVMAVSAKFEQTLITHRPNSYVPGHTTANLFGLSRDRHPDLLNQVHHYGMGMMAGPVRAIMSFYGVIGPVASLLFLPIRILAFDQTAENAAGTSALPWTWPINEQWVDISHKALYALTVGYITDRLVRGVDWFNR